MGELKASLSSPVDAILTGDKNEIPYQDISSELVYSPQLGPLSSIEGLSSF